MLPCRAHGSISERRRSRRGLQKLLDRSSPAFSCSIHLLLDALHRQKIKSISIVRVLIARPISPFSRRRYAKGKAGFQVMSQRANS